MGIFSKKTEEEMTAKRLEGLRTREIKYRALAAKQGFDVQDAIYVMEALYPPDNDQKFNLNQPLVAIFPDKVVQFRRAVLTSSQETVLMKNISSVEISSGLMPTVYVYTSGNTLTFRTDVLQGPKFVEVLRDCLTKRDSGQTSSANSDLDQIEKLGDLLEKGLITKEEFDKKKQQILGL